jgi:hypothetical protein
MPVPTEAIQYNKYLAYIGWLATATNKFTLGLQSFSTDLEYQCANLVLFRDHVQSGDEPDPYLVYNLESETWAEELQLLPETGQDLLFNFSEGVFRSQRLEHEDGNKLVAFYDYFTRTWQAVEPYQAVSLDGFLLH